MRRRIRQAQRAAFSGFTVMVALGRVRRRRPLPPTDGAAALADVMGELLALHSVRTVVDGPVPPPGSVLVANHLGYLDPLIVCAAAPSVPISKASVSRWPVIGLAGDTMGVLFVDRRDAFSGAEVLRRGLRVLRGGARLLNFPEGTTTDGSHVLPFRRGVFGLARIAGAPVVPVTLRYESPSLCWTGDAAFLPHYLDTAARPTTTAHVTFGQPMTISSSGNPADAAREARRQILAALNGGAPRVLHPRIADSRPETGAILDPTERLRVPPPRPDSVLQASGR